MLLLLVFHLYLLQFLLDELIEAFEILMPDVSFYCNLIDFGQKVGLIYIGMHVRIVLVVLKVMLLDLPLPIIQQNLDFFHVDNAINLTSRQLT